MHTSSQQHFNIKYYGNTLMLDKFNKSLAGEKVPEYIY